MIEKASTKRKARRICIAIAVAVLFIGLAVTGYCYFWNHAQYDPVSDHMSEFSHGIEYGYYTAAIIALPTCILLAIILIKFSNDIKKLLKTLAIIVLVATAVGLLAVACAPSGSSESNNSGGTVICPNCGTGWRANHPAAAAVRASGICSACNGR